ncbi:MAG: hypothetical protein KatS3mg119_0452 [Rhodothalassiaceae bacterium]|nr:MAG: hypothetical protein KatS3mg119_0452 [Rhodothalassiaceae bacterium]
MLDDFGIVALPDGGYQLVAGGLNVLVEFDNPAEKEQFDYLINNRNKSSKVIYKNMVKKFSKERTL